MINPYVYKLFLNKKIYILQLLITIKFIKYLLYSYLDAIDLHLVVKLYLEPLIVSRFAWGRTWRQATSCHIYIYIFYTNVCVCVDVCYIYKFVTLPNPLKGVREFYLRLCSYYPFPYAHSKPLLVNKLIPSIWHCYLKAPKQQSTHNNKVNTLVPLFPSLIYS